MYRSKFIISCEVVIFMSDSTQKTGETIETEIKKFGNSAHAIVPKEFVGEKAVVSILSDIDQKLQAPVGVSDLRDVLQQLDMADFRGSSGNTDGLSSGEYIFQDDPRLKVAISREHETEHIRFHRVEQLDVLITHEPDPDTIAPYLDGFDVTELDEMMGDVLWRMDEFEGIIEDVPGSKGFPHHYLCKLYWDGDLIDKFDFEFRVSYHGDMMIPYFKQVESIEEFRDTLRYDVITTLSTFPQAKFDTYLDLIGEEYIKHDLEYNLPTPIIGDGEDADMTVGELAEMASIIRIGSEYVSGGKSE